MAQINETTQGVLDQISEGFAQKGAYNLRQNGVSICHGDSEHIKIRKKEDKPGIDILIDGDTKGEKVFIPVVVSVSGMTDLVYNDFYIADGADVTIVAGCGIHNSGCNESRHDGIHTFHVGKNANVRYEEKHYGEGNGTGSRILNPVTNIEVGENSVFTLDTVQIKGAQNQCFHGGRLQALCGGAYHDRRNTACGVRYGGLHEWKRLLSTDRFPFCRQGGVFPGIPSEGSRKHQMSCSYPV